MNIRRAKIIGARPESARITNTAPFKQLYDYYGRKRYWSIET
jgi:hypothetical protein